MSWHYSHSMPVGKLFKIGVWEDERFVGAVIIGYGSSARLGDRYGLVTGIECVELVRVAMRSHAVPVTQVLAEVLRLLKKTNPGLRLVIAFADPEQGHIGKIYQAGNWLYLGRGPVDYAYVMPGGTRLHKRQFLMNNFTNPRAKVPTRAVKVRTIPKYRYGYPLDRAMRRRLQPLVLPPPTEADLAAEVSKVTRLASG